MAFKDRSHIVISDLGDAPAAGGTPVSLVDGSTGRVVGQFSHVVDATHAKSLAATKGEGASGAFDDVTSMPSGTPLPDQTGAVVSDPTTPGNGSGDGWDDKDPRTPDIGSFAGVGDAMGTVGDYGNHPPQRPGSSITVPQYTKVNSTPTTQVWSQDEQVNPLNIAPMNPEASPTATTSPFDRLPSAPLSHPVWKYPHDVNP